MAKEKKRKPPGGPNVPFPSNLDDDEGWSAWSRRFRRYDSEEREARRRDTICKVFQKTDRILIGTTNLIVKPIDDENLSPGLTTGDEIAINFHWLDGKSDESLIAMYGLNYHELAHVILTPRVRGKLRQRIRDKEFRHAFNICEDWRIETQFSGLFTAANRYFSLAFRKLCVEAKEHQGADEWKMFPLIAGRFYLPTAMRMRYELKAAEALKDRCRAEELQEALKKYPGNEDILNSINRYDHETEDPPEVKANKDLLKAMTLLKGQDRVNKIREVAEEYVRSYWSTTDRDNNRRLAFLIDSLAAVMPWEAMEEGDKYGMPASGSKGIYGADHPSNGQADHDLDGDASNAAAEIIARDQPERERIEQMIKDRDDMRVAGQQQQGKGEGEGEGEEEGDGEDAEGKRPTGSEGPGGSQEHKERKIVIDPRQNVGGGGSGQSDKEQEPEAGHLTAGAGVGGDFGNAEYHAQLTSEQLTELDKIFKDQGWMDALLTEEIKQDLATREITRDLLGMRKAVSEALSEGLHLDPTATGRRQGVPGSMRNERNRLAASLEEIRSKLEGTYLDDQPRGKINIRSWINATPSQRIQSFREWLPDEIDASGLEAVILIDRSSSMASAIDHASQVCWCVASAIENVEGAMTVIGFADPGKEEVLIGRQNKLERSHYQSYGTYGGTTITEALKMAHKVLVASPMENKLLVCITDGGWADIDTAVKEIKKINAHGVESILMLLGLHMERDRRGCHHVVHANDTNELAAQLKGVVRRINVKALKRVQTARGIMID